MVVNMRILFYGLFLLGLNLNFADEALSANPKQALQKLLDGNKRYVNDQLEHPNRSEERRSETALGQKPFAVILGCSDSRVSPEILFDQGIGDLFIVRVAGNVLGPVELDSIEYSAIYLGSSVIMVLGHENCGAIQAVMQGKTKEIEALSSLILPAIDHGKNYKNFTLEEAIKRNVEYVTQELKKSPPLNDLIKNKKLMVVGAYYDFLSGRVELTSKPK